MIKVLEKEYLEGNVGIREKSVYIFGFEFYTYKKTTTNAKAIASFKGVKSTKVKGYETKN